MELGAVSHRASVLAVTLDGALEAFTLGNSSSIDLVAFCEDVSLDLIAKLVFGSILEEELTDMLLHGNTGLVEVALHRLAYAVAVSDFLLAVLVNCGDALFSIAVADLNCLIAVILDCLDLCDYAGASLKDCYRNQSTVFLEDLGHTDLGCHNSFLHVYLFSAALCGEMIYSGHRRVLFFTSRTGIGHFVSLYNRKSPVHSFPFHAFFYGLAVWICFLFASGGLLSGCRGDGRLPDRTFVLGDVILVEAALHRTDWPLNFGPAAYH